MCAKRMKRISSMFLAVLVLGNRKLKNDFGLQIQDSCCNDIVVKVYISVKVNNSRLILALESCVVDLRFLFTHVYDLGLDWMFMLTLLKNDETS